MILKTITIVSTSILLLSCHSNQVLEKNNQIEKNEQQMFQKRITIQDLENQKPIVVKTDKGYENVYSVIIYTNNATELAENGIAVQSKSTKFVTALIKKEQLKKIYQLKSVKSISLPKIDYPNNDNIID